jgi:hypothetical protein
MRDTPDGTRFIIIGCNEDIAKAEGFMLIRQARPGPGIVMRNP